MLTKSAWKCRLISWNGLLLNCEVGTFAVMLALGFSINNLSLFGLVLAIGIVVDDAIVVVENVERNIALGLTPFEAAKRAMSEVTSPIIAIVLTLCAVFVPIAFLGGLTGELYRQFAVTISIAVVTCAIIWAGFKMIFQGARLVDVANILIGGTLIGGAGAFASYIVS